MRERPILFSAPMVRAIIDGRKTQTRRVSGLGLVNARADDWLPPSLCERDGRWVFTAERGPAEQIRARCPYGAPGDLLWVKEAFAHYLCRNLTSGGYTPYTAYRAGRRMLPIIDGGKLGEPVWRDDAKAEAHPWRSPLYMPRALSRLTLEVEAVRVERVQEITQEDAKAEGVGAWFLAADGRKEVPNGVEFAIEYCPEERRDYRRGFQALWDTLNGKRGHPWASNPWVWVVAFSRVEAD